jgi:hypothetical protein
LYITERYQKEIKKLHYEKTMSGDKDGDIIGNINRLIKEYNDILNIKNNGVKYRKQLTNKLPRSMEERKRMISMIKKDIYNYNKEEEKITNKIEQKITKEDYKNYIVDKDE